MTIQEAYGATIRELRKEKKLSQEKLAFESGLDRSFLSLVESGRKLPSLVTIFQIAHGLNILPSRIFAIVEAKCGVTDPMRRE